MYSYANDVNPLVIIKQMHYSELLLRGSLPGGTHHQDLPVLRQGNPADDDLQRVPLKRAPLAPTRTYTEGGGGGGGLRVEY